MGIDRGGTNQTQITNTSYGEWNPSFSPDGKKIVYVSDESGKPDIWVRDIKGDTGQDLRIILVR